ncbi:phosphatidylglycerophosphatase A family protein [Celerinatantimonas yamalensis]|uniref:Phosphatidylglycerophosphatase A n=1 Tax=Celerinatantimonas yamalensis TaxID=559956 RepID=A0ABW9G9L2_9GAMM
MDAYLKRLSLRNPLHLLAVGFGSGLVAKAPGTFGSLAALPLMAWGAWGLSTPVYIVMLVVGFALGVWCCQVASRAMGVHDHGGIVWDEFIGMGIALVAIPLSISSVVCGFVLFRFFDILKPWPIRWLDQHVGGGFGIMIDDVLAGFLAWVIQWGIFHYLIV